MIFIYASEKPHFNTLMSHGTIFYTLKFIIISLFSHFNWGNQLLPQKDRYCIVIMGLLDRSNVKREVHASIYSSYETTLFKAISHKSNLFVIWFSCSTGVEAFDFSMKHRKSTGIDRTKWLNILLPHERRKSVA